MLNHYLYMSLYNDIVERVSWFVMLNMYIVVYHAK